MLGASADDNIHRLCFMPKRHAASRDGSRKGVQIDLLIQTRRSICLVEIKRRREIGREVIDEMEEKVAVLPRRRGISIRTALVYAGHLAPIVEADGYFDAIVPFGRMLGAQMNTLTSRQLRDSSDRYLRDRVYAFEKDTALNPESLA